MFEHRVPSPLDPLGSSDQGGWSDQAPQSNPTPPTGGGMQNSQLAFQSLLNQTRKIDAKSFPCQFPAIGYCELLINRHNDCHPIEPLWDSKENAENH